MPKELPQRQQNRLSAVKSSVKISCRSRLISERAPLSLMARQWPIPTRPKPVAKLIARARADSFDDCHCERMGEGRGTIKRRPRILRQPHCWPLTVFPFSPSRQLSNAFTGGWYSALLSHQGLGIPRGYSAEKLPAGVVAWYFSSFSPGHFGDTYASQGL